MKIAITADIHHAPGFTSKATIQSMMSRILSHNPDLVIAAGDIGETSVGTSWFSNALFELSRGTKCAAVLGNHDIWTKRASTSSLYLWESVLPKIMDDLGIFYLERNNWVQDGIAIVGSYLHYDYSAQDHKGLGVGYITQCFPDWSFDEYYERMKKHSNNDGKFLIGLPSDKDFAQTIGAEFCSRLDTAENDPNVHSIVIVTHVPCMSSQITRHPFNKSWSLGTPYFGNLSHEKFILGLTKVKHIISAHSHNKNESVVTADDGHDIQVQTLEAEYGNPTAIVIEV